MVSITHFVLFLTFHCMVMKSCPEDFPFFGGFKTTRYFTLTIIVKSHFNYNSKVQGGAMG